MAAKQPLKPAAPEPLVTLATVDYAGIMRGRSFARRSYDASRSSKTCGWVPANMSLTPFDVIADPNPWGSKGDLRLLPDDEACYRAWLPGAATPLDVVMSDIVELDGKPWTCCPRAFLKNALLDFKAATGSEIIASFEQEFQILDAGWPAAPSFALSALRRADPFGPELMAALEQAGLEPEVFIAEYGKDQFEITGAPAKGLVAADRAAFAREIVRELARLHGWRASFAPKTAVQGVGNGVHVHLSFLDARGRPTAHDSKQPGKLSARAASFCAGILRYMPALIAFTAPSPISGLRLKPHHWSSSYTWLGDRDREASLRICPVVTIGGKDAAKQFNIEYRAADATASPHLLLGVIIRAGLAGIRDKLAAPPIFSGDPETLSPEKRNSFGLHRLPDTLPDALTCLAKDREIQSWFSAAALETYTGMKQMELKLCAGLEGDALCARYAGIY
ncbi:MAG: glutamine synthetase [Parvibaculaceae bacterium]